ncbi:armadillo-type protein [Limtongia smithiae]|uniref:armadillo-type protein n=1 Tax=Limtongia smithiae TaxID=1125753 RepID=UPI0034D00368
MGCCSSCCGGQSQDQLYAPLLAESEREAVSVLLRYLENVSILCRGARLFSGIVVVIASFISPPYPQFTDHSTQRGEEDFFSSGPLRALTTLVYSSNVDLQRSAALAFAEITEKDVQAVNEETLSPILLLLQSPDFEVQRAASAALGNLAVNNDNKLLIVEMGGLEPLIKQMQSTNVEVQCNAVGCITNLATHEENKVKIARSGALVPLTKLAKSKDSRVQRNATGALLNMTHSDENRQELVNAGAIPVLVSLLTSPDADVQYYCTTALSNIAVDATNRKILAETEPKLVSCLVGLMTTGATKVQCQAALALRNLASDDKCQLEIVQAGGLSPLLRLLQSNVPQLVLSSVACIRNISIHADNESPIIEAGFLKPLVSLLRKTGVAPANAATPASSPATEEEIQCHAISTLRNLAASSERNKKAIVEAGAVDKCISLVLTSPSSVQSEMTACIAVLALSDELKAYLLSMNIIDVLLPLTMSPNPEVQGNSGAALGNLSSKIVDYSPFVKTWESPADGVSGYLIRFLNSNDLIFEHIAAWTLLQFMEGGDKALIRLIEKTQDIVIAAQMLAAREVTHEQPANGDLIDMEDTEAETEIIALAGRVLKMLDESR